jgi:carboxymethylenebutenolidase
LRRAPEDVEQVLPRACPIVGSFGAKDRWPGMRTAPDRIETALTAGNIDRDVKRYPHAGHGFMNDRKPAELSISDKVIAKLVGARYDEPASSDARTRITAFFRKHLNWTA